MTPAAQNGIQTICTTQISVPATTPNSTTSTASMVYRPALVNRASNRYTLAVRCFYSASPLFLWLFDSWFFIALTLFWSIKFIAFQDFAHVLRQSGGRSAA